jgi:hypothetical protein
MLTRLAFTVLCGALLMSACDRPDHDSDRASRRDFWDHESSSRDSDKDAEPEFESTDGPRSVENFDRIRLRGAAQLKINIGPEPTVKVEGSQRRIKEVEVQGDTLVINVAKTRGWFEDTHRVRVTVTVPQLKDLDSNGAGEIEIDGLNGGEQSLDLAGAHDIKARGWLDSLDIKVSGAGNVDYTQVAAKDVQVNVKGAGNVEINASESLDAEVNGVGAVRYTGKPKRVQSEMHGLGTISASNKPEPTAAPTSDTPANASDSPAQPTPSTSPTLPTPPTPPTPPTLPAPRSL